MRNVTILTAISLLFVGSITAADARAESRRVLPVRAYTAEFPAGMEISRTYFTATTATEEEFREFRRQLIEHGARHVNLFLPDVIVCELPADLDVSALSGHRGAVRREEAVVGPFLGAGRSSRESWIKRAYELADEVNAPRPGMSHSGPAGASDVGFNDVVVFPTREKIRETNRLLRESGFAAQDERGASQNSEFFGGNILVQLVLPESNGQWDPSLEDWSDEEVAAVVSAAWAGMLAVQSHFPSMRMDFVFQVYARATTGYEAIRYPMGDDQGWISDVIERLDNSIPSDNVILQLHAFNVKGRERHKTDFVFTGFIVNSENAPNHMFHGANYTAYAFLGGPFNITPYPAGRDPNGIGDALVFSQIFQHETGHIFWALDEYEASPSECNESSGYLWYRNMNKDSWLFPGPDACDPAGPFDCLMRYAAREDIGRPWCRWTQGQMGVIDDDANGIPDIYESPPRIEFAVAATETVQTPDVTIDLKVISTAVPNQNENHDEGNRIDYAVPLGGARYSMPGWQERSINPVDGRWDEIEEDVRLRIPHITSAGQLISIAFKAKNEAGVWSRTYVKKIFFVGVSYRDLGVYADSDRIRVKWNVFDERWDPEYDVYRIDPGESYPGRLIKRNVPPQGEVGGYTHYRYSDREDIKPGKSYRYYVNARFTIVFDEMSKDYEARSNIVERTAMIPISDGIISRSAPNPFRDRTQLSVSVPAPRVSDARQTAGAQGGAGSGFEQLDATNVEVAVFDVAGRLVKTLHSGGVYEDVVTVTWDGTGSNSERVPSGIYFIQAKAGDAIGVRKVLLLR